MRSILKYFTNCFSKKKNNESLTETSSNFIKSINKIVGYSINNHDLFEEAFTLRTCSKQHHKNYERLEFLGDSALGTIISNYLLLIYPEADEGFLTQMKSKIVNRNNLNKLGKKLHLDTLIVNKTTAALSENITGNLLESLVGAIFIDTNYDTCKKVVMDRLLTPSDIHELENKIVSYKSLLLEWAQKNKKVLKYKTVKENSLCPQSVFRCFVYLENEKIANATAASIKKAEEKSAQRAFYVLNKKLDILGKTSIIS